jgi:hypothetical protein
MTSVQAMGLTTSARRGIRELGLTELQALKVIQDLTQFEFHKSMPCDTEPGNWQDVYKAERKGVEIYVKFQEDTTNRPDPPQSSGSQPPTEDDCVEERCFVISFKEWTDEW